MSVLLLPMHTLFQSNDFGGFAQVLNFMLAVCRGTCLHRLACSGQGLCQTFNLGWAREVHLLIFVLFFYHFLPVFLNFFSFSSSIWSSRWVACSPGKVWPHPLVLAVLTVLKLRATKFTQKLSRCQANRPNSVWSHVGSNINASFTTYWMLCEYLGVNHKSVHTCRQKRCFLDACITQGWYRGILK